MFDSVLPKTTAASEGAESTEGHGALREIRKLREIRGCGFLFLFLPGLVLAQAGRPLAIEDYYRVKTVSVPAMSPDGKWVAFTVGTRTEATNADSAEVWLVPADGSAAGGRTRPGRSGEERLASPDGKWTALLRSTPPPARETSYASDFERRHEERFKGVSFDWLEFQRDGAPFPVPNAADPYTNPAQEIFLNPGGAGERQLTHLGLRPVGLQWSPDGNALLFTADSSYRDERRYEHSQVWSVGLDGTVRRLSSDADYDYTAASYSPDGKWILYTRQLSTDAVIARKMDNGGPTDLAIIPAGGGAERLLTAEWDYLPSGARWSPDGKWIYFSGGVGGTIHLFRASANGGAVQQVTRGERRIQGLSFDKAM